MLNVNSYTAGQTAHTTLPYNARQEAAGKSRTVTETVQNVDALERDLLRYDAGG